MGYRGERYSADTATPRRKAFDMQGTAPRFENEAVVPYASFFKEPFPSAATRCFGFRVAVPIPTTRRGRAIACHSCGNLMFSRPEAERSGKRAMRTKYWIIGLTLFGGLAACGDTYLERGTTGALIGAGAAAATDNDVATGVALGAGAGIITR